MDIFVDTSAWYAIRDESDRNHKVALRFWKEIQIKGYLLITSDEVIQESATLLQGRLGKQAALDFLEYLEVGEENGEIVIIPVDEELKAEAWQIFKKYVDKEYSFCDCTSFCIMRRYQYQHAFAFDEDFEHFSFTALPTSK